MLVSLDKKYKAFAFDWKLSWKFFEKYLKQKEGVREQPLISQRRYQIIAFVKRTLNDNKIRFITSKDLQKVKETLLNSAGDNKFYQKASEMFINFLENFLE
jgi:hypothetical protein